MRGLFAYGNAKEVGWNYWESWLEELWYYKIIRFCLRSSLFHLFLESYSKQMLKMDLWIHGTRRRAVWKSEEPFSFRQEVGNAKWSYWSVRWNLGLCFLTLNQVSSHKQPSFQSHISNFIQYGNLAKAFKQLKNIIPTSFFLHRRRFTLWHLFYN